MIIRRDVFQAIADPTRRQIIDIIATEPLTLNAIADQFEVSRQAISVHVKILTECGLIVITQKGRERYCKAKLDTLSEVSAWVSQYEQVWKSRFANLEKHLDSVTTKNKKNENIKRRKQ